jgi:acetyl esterase/lipase
MNRNCMRRSTIFGLSIVLLAGLQGFVAAQDRDLIDDKTPYVQHENIVYAETDGIGLVMDIFTPKRDANGLGIVDIASGAWSSDRGKINDHKQAQMFNIMCGRGYTVFAVRPGSSSKFTVPEMLKHLKQGIRWVKAHADEYKIDPEKLAITGASAGGHLACLGVTTAEDGNPSAKNPLDKFDTKVKCAAVFFPPTDFLNWGTMKINPTDAKGPVAQMIGKLLYPGGISDQTPEEIEEAIRKISPFHQVTGKEPPFLLIHGDADFVVPLQQSKIMVEAFTKAGVPVELIIKKGGGHPWLTIHEEIAVAADWIDKQLGAESQSSDKVEPASDKKDAAGS